MVIPTPKEMKPRPYHSSTECFIVVVPTDIIYSLPMHIQQCLAYCHKLHSIVLVLAGYLSTNGNEANGYSKSRTHTYTKNREDDLDGSAKELYIFFEESY